MPLLVGTRRGQDHDAGAHRHAHETGEVGRREHGNDLWLLLAPGEDPDAEPSQEAKAVLVSSIESSVIGSARTPRQDDHLGLSRLGGVGADLDRGLGAEGAGDAHAPVGRSLITLGHRVGGPGRRSSSKVPAYLISMMKTSGPDGLVPLQGCRRRPGRPGIAISRRSPDLVPGKPLAPPLDDAGEREQ